MPQYTVTQLIICDKFIIWSKQKSMYMAFLGKKKEEKRKGNNLCGFVFLGCEKEKKK